MTHHQRELEQLRSLIDADDPETRYRHEPSLRLAIERTRDADEAVPAHIKQLHSTLLSEAIEAEFDNLPV